MADIAPTARMESVQGAPDEDATPALLSLQESWQILSQRLSADIGEADPAPWHQVDAAFVDMMDRGDRPGFIRQRKLQARVEHTLLHALLAGDLSAWWTDGTPVRVPAWAWEHGAKQRSLWDTGRLWLDGRLPDPWPDRSGMAVMIDRDSLNRWLDNGEHCSDSDLPTLPEAVDLHERPELLSQKPPAERSYIALGEAVSWVAFRFALPRDVLERSLNMGIFGADDDADEKLANAAGQLADHVAGGKLGMRGRHRASPDSIPDGTRDIPQPRMHDFRAYNLVHDTWERGTGLGYGESADAFVDVQVNRKDLLACFPSADAATAAELSSGVRRYNDEERRQWMLNHDGRNVNKAFNAYQADPRQDLTNQAQFREEWKELRPMPRGRPRKNMK